MKSEWSVSVPAKALLFGEYALLRGDPGVCVTFWERFFSLKVSLVPLPKDGAKFNVRSRFFPEGKQCLSHQEYNHLLEKYLQKDFGEDHPLALFVAPFLGQSDFFEPTQINIEVLSSYPPSLGYGSSSAILSALFHVVHVRIFKQDPLRYWGDILRALHFVQGSGSGYDIACQLTAMKNENKHPALYKVTVNKEDCAVEKLDVEWGDKRFWGGFLPTGQWANTSAALSHFSHLSDEQKRVFAQHHANLVQEFTGQKTQDSLPKLFSKAQKIAREQGILPPDLKTPVPQGWSWKTMGAGLGDCLWVVPPAGVSESDWQAFARKLDWSFYGQSQ